MNHSQLLQRASYDLLRAVAANLHLRKRGDSRLIWIQQIEQLWLSPEQQAHWLSSLSLPACRALWRLVETPYLPASLFLADFGPLYPAERRKATAGVPLPKIKRSPQQISPAQALYALGLLFDAEGKPIEPDGWLVLPDDLRQPIARWLRLQWQRWQLPLPNPSVSNLVSPSSFVLLHDLVQLLAFARLSPAALRPGSRFPLQADWQLLQPRLLALRTRRLPANLTGVNVTDVNVADVNVADVNIAAFGAEWLRLLHFLAEAAGLLAHGVVQPLLWRWLHQSSPEQLITLWQGWQTASDTLRARFHRLNLAGVSGWQQVMTNWAASEERADRPIQFSAVDLTHRLIALAHPPPFVYLHWFARLSELDEYWQSLLTELCQLGVVEFAGLRAAAFLRPLDGESRLELANSEAERLYRLSDWGRWLLGFAGQTKGEGAQLWQGGSSQWLSSGFDHLLDSASPKLVEPAASQAEPTWHLLRHAEGDPATLFLLAPFCATLELVAQADLAVDGQSFPSQDKGSGWLQQLRVTTRSLALAAAQGYTAADLWQFVQQAGLQLRPADWRWLQEGLRLGRRLQLRPANLLVSEDANLMHQLQQNRRLRPHLGEMLTPTVATWYGDGGDGGNVEDWQALLRAEGFFPSLAADPQMQEASRQENADKQESAGKDGKIALEPLCLETGDAPVLWLALQLYERLGRFAALPLRATPETVRQLFAALTHEQQASLVLQARQIEDALSSAIDQLPFAPPKAPSDPAVWRPLIERALTEKQDLQLIHWSAGRNLPVRRRVTPFYIDDDRFGGPTLRAWCHHSGNDLWFRLDRIMEMLLITQPDGHGLS